MAEKKFNGRQFKVDPLLATKATVLQARLFKLAGPAIYRIPEIMAGFGNKSPEIKAQSNAAAIGAFASIFAEADPDDFAKLLKDVIEVAQVKGESGEYRKVDFDGDFTFHQGDIIPVTVWILREQFGDFFSGLRDIGNLAK